MLKLSLDKLSLTLINALLTKKRQLEALNINELDEKHVRACLRNLSLLPDQLFFSVNSIRVFSNKTVYPVL